MLGATLSGFGSGPRDDRPFSRMMARLGNCGKFQLPWNTMSLLVYFDTNVFYNLIKKTNGVTDEDELRLRSAVSSAVGNLRDASDSRMRHPGQ